MEKRICRSCMERSAAERGMRLISGNARLACYGFRLSQGEIAALCEPLVRRRKVAAEMRAAAFLATKRRGRNQLARGEHIRKARIADILRFQRRNRSKRAAKRRLVANDADSRGHRQTELLLGQAVIADLLRRSGSLANDNLVWHGGR